MGQRARESRPYGCPLPTLANADVFTRYRREIRALEDAFPAQPGSAAVFALDDALCLDAVSRPDAFAHLWPKLRAGYLLDARTPRRQACARARSDPRLRRRGRPRHGNARPVRRARRGRAPRRRVIGSGLELAELLQLSAFTSEDGGARAFGRIARPSADDEDPLPPVRRRPRLPGARHGHLFCLTILGLPIGLTLIAAGFKAL